MLCLSLFVVCVFLGFIQNYKSCFLIQYFDLELFIGKLTSLILKTIDEWCLYRLLLICHFLMECSLSFGFLVWDYIFLFFLHVVNSFKLKFFLIVPSILLDFEVYIFKFSFTLKRFFSSFILIYSFSACSSLGWNLWFLIVYILQDPLGN